MGIYEKIPNDTTCARILAGMVEYVHNRHLQTSTHDQLLSQGFGSLTFQLLFSFVFILSLFLILILEPIQQTFGNL